MSDSGHRPTGTKGTQTPEWKRLMVEYSQDATLHGVGHASNGKSSLFRRGVWLLALVAAIATCSFMVMTQIIHYFSYPINTIETTVEVDTLDFPTITICNYNVYKRSVVTSDLTIASILENLSPLPRTLNWSDPDIAAYADLDTRDVLKRAAHTLNETFLHCWWNQVIFNCADYFETIVSDFQICYAFNTRRSLEENRMFNITRRGALRGLKVRINVKQEEYYSFIDEITSAGIRIVIHDPNDLPSVEELGKPVGPGTETHLAITQQQVKRLPEPYAGGDCLQTNEDFVNPLEYFAYYTYDGCRQECIYRFVENACGCVPFMVTVNLTRPRCNLRETVDCCVDKFLEYYASNKTNDCKCKTPCEETGYEVSQSFALFPSDFVLEVLENDMNVSGEYIRSNVMDVVVYYHDMNYQLVEQTSSYTASNAFGDIGGQMGICLGASLLTLMELGDLFIRIVPHLFKRQT